jgi:phosphatidylserine decarboxylase
MAKTIKEWLATDVAEMKKISQEHRDQNEFFRQPSRPLLHDPSRMFSPADGILIYCQHVDDPDETVINAKGAHVSLRDLTRIEHWDAGAWVAGVFMTQYSVHSNCVPYQCVLNYRLLPSLKTKNDPMLETERGLLDGVLRDFSDFEHDNERMINTCYNASLDYTWHIVQLADYDVDCITCFSAEQNVVYQQCQRFGFIRMGSQCDLILPDKDGLEFAPLLDPLMAVEGGVDALFKVHRD